MKLFLSILLSILCWSGSFAFVPLLHPTSFSLKTNSRAATTAALTRLFAEKPFAVIVKATIEPDRMAEFLKMIEFNAKETRKEPDCLRFDVLRSQDAENEFFFYELYKNAAAIDYHKKQPHYNLWADFKASGGTIESISYKADGEFLTGWFFDGIVLRSKDVLLYKTCIRDCVKKS